jgi:hypothetical protein
VSGIVTNVNDAGVTIKSWWENLFPKSSSSGGTTKYINEGEEGFVGPPSPGRDGNITKESLDAAFKNIYDWKPREQLPLQVGETSYGKTKKGGDVVYRNGDFVATKATGGEINTTGMYGLHAGERVIPAERNRNSSNNQNITNYFTISANISNDLDIRQLAKKLAEYSESQMRRRVSY